MPETDEKSDTRAASHGVDARTLWSPFTMHPFRIETPATWHPILVEWNANTARARWESLTSTPLELSWAWRDRNEPADKVYKKLEDAWKREAASAEGQAKKLKIPFQWTADRSDVRTFANVGMDGYVRTYTWDGRPGILLVVVLGTGTRRAFVAGALCPPPFEGKPPQRRTKEERRQFAEFDAALEEASDPATVQKRVLKSMGLAAADEPVRIAIGKFDLELPAGFLLESVKSGDGQLYVDARTKERRINVARVGFSDLRLHMSAADKLYAHLTKTLFDRSESPDPLTGTQNPFGPGMKRADEPRDSGGATLVHRHEASLFEERRRFHIRFGDWVLRTFGRKWSGGAASLVWHCSETRSIWALCVRSGEKSHLDEARARLDGVRCHGSDHQRQLDWSAYINAESAPPPPAKQAKKEQKAENDAKDKKDAKKEGPTQENPVLLRKQQLRFRVRARPEVRMEPSKKDGTGDLVYEGAPAKGFVAALLRGRAPAQVRYRRLTLDPMGRRVWEMLSEGKGATVGEMLAEMSNLYHVHPVEMFPKLLTFLRMLGERRLVEGDNPKA